MTNIIRQIFGFTLVLMTWNAYAQDEGNELLEEHFKAVGQDIWNQLQDVAVDGRWVDENYMGHKIKLTYKAPDKVRIEGKYDKKTFVEAYNGTYGWIVAPWKKEYEPQQMDEVEELLIQNSFSLGSPLHPYRSELSFTGLQDMEGTVYSTFTFEDEEVKKTFYLGQDDANLYYERIELKNSENAILKIYEAYRSFNRLILPTAVRFEAKGIEKELVYDQVYIGLGARDSLFEPPKGQ